MDLSVVIPCFNEQDRLPPALRIALAGLGPRLADSEVILVDDGSTDQTFAALGCLEQEFPAVRPLRLQPNRGKGAAIALGVAHSRGRSVLLSDADFSTPIEELGQLEAALAGGADIAIGSRAKKGAREIDQPAYRVLMGKSFNLLVQALVLPGVWDTQCGFKLFRGDVARLLFGQLQIDGFAYDVEILWRARQSGYRIEEVPVRWLNSDSSRVATIRHSSQMLRDVVRLRLGR
ncbi:MAG: dolichyl-phosphate beta-glucosyltransferase [Candidatus Dormibacteraceae bacterium]